MRINSINSVNRIKFASNPSENKSSKQQNLSSDELLIKKTKKTARLCLLIVTGLAVLYFAFIRNHKINKKISFDKIMNKKAQAAKPFVENVENLCFN